MSSILMSCLLRRLSSNIAIVLKSSKASVMKWVLRREDQGWSNGRASPKILVERVGKTRNI